MNFARHYEHSALLGATVEQAFAYLDDFRALSAHMEKRSGMMAGSAMHISMDHLGGRAVGSRVRMEGRMLGIKLRLEEVITERNPPLRKVWETVEAALVVIGSYRLGFELSPKALGATLRIFIDYDRPAGGLAQWLAGLLAGRYARWCVDRMVGDAVSRFAQHA